MLKGIPHILSPELLHALQAMGHGDEIAVVDGNYPGESAGPIMIRADGHASTDLVEAILTLMPLDSFVPDHAVCMQVVGAADKRMPVMDEFEAIIKRHEPDMKLSSIERFAFYARAKTAYAIVQTGERRLYGNLIMKKGVIHPEA